MSEKNINVEQLSLQRDELVSRNQQIVQTVDEACQRIPDLSIFVDLPTEMRIHCLESGVQNAYEETMHVQLELNL